METPLSPNWPAAWISAFTFLLSPLKAFLLPRVPEAWRYTAAAVTCYAFTIFAAWQTPLLGSEVAIQGGVLLAMVFAGYAAARSGVGLATGLGAAGLGIGASAGAALILPAFAQDPTAVATVADSAKEAAKSQVMFWVAWAFSVLGGKLGRWLDGKRETHPA